MKKAVHLPEREQFEFLISKWNPKGLEPRHWSNENRTITIEHEAERLKGCIAYIEYDTNAGYQILTFSEWLKENNFEKEWEERNGIKWEPKNGEMIEVSVNGNNWIKRYFLGMDNDLFVCKAESQGLLPYSGWIYARPISIFTLSEAKAIIAETKNLNIENIEIV